MGGRNGHKYGGLTLHTPKIWRRVIGSGMCTIMWLWVLHRARKDGPVLMGWRHPWEAHGDGHGAGVQEEEEVVQEEEEELPAKPHVEPRKIEIKHIDQIKHTDKKAAKENNLKTYNLSDPKDREKAVKDALFAAIREGDQEALKSVITAIRKSSDDNTKE